MVPPCRFAYGTVNKSAVEPGSVVNTDPIAAPGRPPLADVDATYTIVLPSCVQAGATALLPPVWVPIRVRVPLAALALLASRSIHTRSLLSLPIITWSPLDQCAFDTALIPSGPCARAVRAPAPRNGGVDPTAPASGSTSAMKSPQLFTFDDRIEYSPSGAPVWHPMHAPAPRVICWTCEVTSVAPTDSSPTRKPLSVVPSALVQ